MCPKKQLLGGSRMSEVSEGRGTGGSSRTTGTDLLNFLNIGKHCHQIVCPLC